MKNSVFSHLMFKGISYMSSSKPNKACSWSELKIKARISTPLSSEGEFTAKMVFVWSFIGSITDVSIETESAVF